MWAPIPTSFTQDSSYMEKKFETVIEFKDWWLKAGCPIRPPFANAIYTTEMSHTLVLYRVGPFQVELCTCKPNSQAPMHSHPGVDSYFIYLTGNIDFGLSDGSFTDSASLQREGKGGAHLLMGQGAHAMSGAMHTLKVKEEGGAFLSFEKWNGRTPDSVTVNWEGDPIGDEHSKALLASYHL
jgi:hypothetical protein